MNQHIPQILIKAALAKNANIGRDYDSDGKHVAYWYQVPNSNWRVYRHNIRGMLHVLKYVNHA